MFLPDLHSDIPTGNQLLAEIGLDPQDHPRDHRGRSRHALSRPGRVVSQTPVRGPLPGHAVPRGSLELEEGLRRVNEGVRESDPVPDVRHPSSSSSP